MAESTLTAAFNDLQAEIGRFLGWGAGAVFGDPAWDSRKQGIIDAGTKKGLRRFYFSALIPGEATAHDWSFLRPTASLALAAAATSIALPDDFGGLEGTGDIMASANEMEDSPIEQVGVGRLRGLFARFPSETGPPRYSAVVPLKATTATAGQRWELQVFPAADQAYTVECEYYILPDYLSGSLPFCYGGAAHSGTILEACLAAVERDLDNTRSVHEAHYQDLLAASVSYDRNYKTQVYGPNMDSSDERGRRRRRPEGYRGQFATFSGVLYDGN